jgi:hypothetical protein
MKNTNIITSATESLIQAAEAKVASIKAALDQQPDMYYGARLQYAEDLITLERELERLKQQEDQA